MVQLVAVGRVVQNVIIWGGRMARVPRFYELVIVRLSRASIGTHVHHFTSSRICHCFTNSSPGALIIALSDFRARKLI